MYRKQKLGISNATAIIQMALVPGMAVVTTIRIDPAIGMVTGRAITAATIGMVTGGAIGMDIITTAIHSHISISRIPSGTGGTSTSDPTTIIHAFIIVAGDAGRNPKSSLKIPISL